MRIQEQPGTGSGTAVLARPGRDRDQGPAGLAPGSGRDPAARRRSALFGPLLRTLRTAAGASLDDVARLLDRDRSGVQRMEAGLRGIAMDDLAAILDGYGFAGDGYRSLMGAAHTPFRDWWAGYPAVMTGDFRPYALLELAASRVLAWQPAGVPDLVQCPEWALAAARRSPHVQAGDEEKHAAAVAARREAVLSGRYAASLDVILGSPMPTAAGLGPAAAKQAALLAVPPAGTQVRYAPAADSWLPPAGPFTVLEFGSGPVQAVVHLPGPGGGSLITAPRTVGAYISSYQSLDRSARVHRRPAA